MKEMRFDELVIEEMDEIFDTKELIPDKEYKGHLSNNIYKVIQFKSNNTCGLKLNQVDEAYANKLHENEGFEHLG